MRDSSVHFDFETRSAVNLLKSGVYPYAAHPTTDVWCAAFAFGDEPDIDLWEPGQPMPSRLREHVESGLPIFAHNAQFERVIWREIMGPRYGWAVPKMDQYHCTAAMAAAMALPRSLEDLGAALNLPIQKDMKGSSLMKRMAKPRKILDDGTILWWDDAERKEKLFAYCRRDVESERIAEKKLRPLSTSERQVYLLDQVINDRGILIDDFTVRQSLEVIAQTTRVLDAEITELTAGAVTRSTQVAKLVEWLGTQGVQVGNLRKQELGELMKAAPDDEGDEPGEIDVFNLAPGEVPDDARRAIEIRLEAAKASAKKLQAMIDAQCDDGYVRGLLLYHGASTGRWSGKLVQPQNMKRPEDKKPERFIPSVQTGDYRIVEMCHGKPMTVVSDITRSMIVAGAGQKFVCADFANIEGRGIAWLAGEKRKLDMFRAYDTFKTDEHGQLIPDGKGSWVREGHDIYKLTAGGILGKKPEDINSDERQAYGKVPELACIAEGQDVLTDQGLVPIEQVTREMRVWDGEAWVAHEGVISRGVKLVVGYDGLEATPDHLVWGDCFDDAIPLGRAASNRHSLIITGISAGPVNARWRMRGVAPDQPTVIGDRPVYDIVNAGPNHRFTVSGRLVHNCGYQGGVGAFQAMAKVYGVKVTDAEAEQIKTGWREKHPRIKQFWYDLENAAIEAVQYPGRRVDVGYISYVVKKHFLWCRLPSGRMLAYCAPKLMDVQTPWGETKEAVTYMGVNSVTRKWQRQKAYGGLWSENCLAGDTEVLTTGGWKPIVDVGIADQVWDGVEWVDHEGLAAKGRATTIWLSGVRLTPDHLVLTDAGWLPAENASGFLLAKTVLPGHQDAEAMRVGSFTTAGREQVYDLVNCGPRHRFVVRPAGGGNPFIVHNCTQAVARDVMSEAMIRAEEAGLQICLTVHDEILARVPEDHTEALQILEKIMETPPAWAAGFPIAAEGWEGQRYRK